MAGSGTTTEIVTVLFCDLVGSTALLSRLGDDANDALRREVFVALREPLSRHRGEEVKSQGDGLMVAFRSSAAEAVACAVEMHRSVHRLDRREPLGLAIRVGLSLGEATFEEDDWFGTPVVEAARLCALARPRQILATDVVRAVVGSRGGFDFSPVGALVLKGFPDPVPSCEVAWEPEPDLPECPLPVGLDDPSDGFAGRAAEFAVLGVLWDAVCAGAGRSVVVSGGAGIGKTELVMQFARGLHRDGAVVLYGGGGEPIAAGGGLAEALRWYAAAMPPEVLREQLGPDGDALIGLVPALRGRLPELRERPVGDPDAERERQGRALREWLARAAAARPLVLVLDDFHASSPRARALCRAALTPTPPAGVLVVVCERDEPPGGVSRGEWPAAAGGIERIGLVGLAHDAVGALARSSGVVLDASDLDRLARESAGNPLVVLDVLGRLERVSGSLDAAITATCPYRGLAAFGADDAEVFVGRDDEVATLLARLGVARLVAVVGASGSGKSSLVRAGVLPAIRRGALRGSERWRTVIVTPGPRPLAELAAALAQSDGDGSAGSILAALTAGDASPLVSQPDGRRLMVVVDQFEELFTLCEDGAERARFVDLVIDAVTQPGSATTFVVALRADFYGHCAAFPALAAVLESHHVLLGAMGDDELRRVIEEPARHAGLALEAGLAELMLRDISGEPGGLPLLSHALLETWRRRHGRIMTVQGYRAAGGVRGAIARTADDVFDALDADGQSLARGVFVRLTELGEGTEDTRRRARHAELLPQGSDPAALDRVVEALTGARLLTVGDDTVEVAHEALIREWPRLRGWLDDDRDALRTLRHLAGATRDWDQRGRNDDDVYRGPRLAAAIELAERPAASLTATERDYVDAGRVRLEREQRHARRQVHRLQRALAAAIVAVLVASGAGVVALHQRNRAGAATRDAELRGLVSESRGLVSQDRALATLLVAEAYRRKPDANARDGLLGAVLADPRLRRSFGPTAGVTWTGRLTGTRVAVAAARLAIATPNGYELSVWNWKTGEREAWPGAPRAGAGRGCANASPVGLSTSPKGERIAVVSADGLLHVYSGRTLEAQGEPFKTGLDPFPACDAQIAFSPNARWLAVANGQFNLHGKSTGETVVLFERSRDGWRRGPPLTGHRIRVDALAFSRDSSILATGSPAGTNTEKAVIVLHDVHTGKTGRIIETSDDPFFLALDWDHHRVVAGSVSRDTLVYDLDKPLEPTPIRGHGTLSIPFYNAEWKQLAISGSGGFRLLDADSLEPIDGPDIEPNTAGGAVVYLPNDQILLASFSGPMTVWDLRFTSVLQRVIPKLASVSPTARPDVFISPKSTSDGTFVTILGPDYQPLTDEIRVGASQLFGPTVCADPRTNRIATVGTGSPADKGDIVVRRGVPPFEVMRRMRRLVDFVPLTCAWRPDGKQIAIGGVQGEVALYQVATGEIRRVPARQQAFALSLAYRPDATELWVTSPAGAPVRITNLDSTPQVTPALALGAISALRFTPDGRFLVTADLTRVQVLDAHSLKPVTDHIPATTDTIFLVLVSPDGHAAVTSDIGGWMRRVDLRAGRAIGPRMRVAFPGLAVFGRDDTTIYASTPDGRASVWDLAPDRVRDAACALAGRNLTQEEWRSYLPWDGPRRATCAQFPQG